MNSLLLCSESECIVSLILGNMWTKSGFKDARCDFSTVHSTSQIFNSVWKFILHNTLSGHYVSYSFSSFKRNI